MPIRNVPGTDLKYHLIAFDAEGNERAPDPDGAGPQGLLSQRVLESLSGEAYTDIFILSHGWKGDMPAAIDQYDRWIKAMADNQDDRQRMRNQRPGFKALLIGFHWPSQPWGDESLGGAGVSFGAPATDGLEDPLEGMINNAAERIADTPAARDALRIIFDAARRDARPGQLPPEVAQAYATLNGEAGLGGGGAAAAPEADREPFDPERYYQATRQDEQSRGGGVSFGGGFSLGGLLSPLRQLSFWTMKARGRKVGERGGAQLLRALQSATTEQVRFHLMGHSFGCIVVSSMLCGVDERGQLLRPVNSVALVQGALSLWSYCSRITHAGDQPGYFRSLIADHRVAGPIITTHSKFDTAVGRFYPLGAGLARQVVFDPTELPKYGGLGAYGIQGPDIDLVELSLKAATEEYGFQAGKVYNLECSHYINQMDGASGAHSDIAKPEVAHAVWQAAQAH